MEETIFKIEIKNNSFEAKKSFNFESKVDYKINNKSNNTIFNNFCSKFVNYEDEQILSTSPNLSNEKFWPPPTSISKKRRELITYLLFKLN